MNLSVKNYFTSQENYEYIIKIKNKVNACGKNIELENIDEIKSEILKYNNNNKESLCEKINILKHDIKELIPNRLYDATICIMELIIINYESSINLILSQISSVDKLIFRLTKIDEELNAFKKDEIILDFYGDLKTILDVIKNNRDELIIMDAPCCKKKKDGYCEKCLFKYGSPLGKCIVYSYLYSPELNANDPKLITWVKEEIECLNLKGIKQNKYKNVDKVSVKELKNLIEYDIKKTLEYKSEINHVLSKYKIELEKIKNMLILCKEEKINRNKIAENSVMKFLDYLCEIIDKYKREGKEYYSMVKDQNIPNWLC